MPTEDPCRKYHWYLYLLAKKILLFLSQVWRRPENDDGDPFPITDEPSIHPHHHQPRTFLLESRVARPFTQSLRETNCTHACAVKSRRLRVALTDVPETKMAEEVHKLINTTISCHCWNGGRTSKLKDKIDN